MNEYDVTFTTGYSGYDITISVEAESFEQATDKASKLAREMLCNMLSRLKPCKVTDVNA